MILPTWWSTGWVLCPQNMFGYVESAPAGDDKVKWCVAFRKLCEWKVTPDYEQVKQMTKDRWAELF